MSWKWQPIDNKTLSSPCDIPRVLVIDDDADDQRIISRFLKKMFGDDLALEFESNWLDAKAAVEACRHDIYIFDQNLCHGTGLEIIESVACEEDPRVFILLTGGDDPAVDKAATRAGVADYLIKGELTFSRLERSLRYATESMWQKRRLVEQANQLRDAKTAIEAEVLKHQTLTAELRQVQAQLQQALKRSEESETRQRWLAQHDPLTKIPNRNLFDEKLRHMIAEAAQNNAAMALFLLDIDHFKLVNDTFGHQIGDGLLIQVADRIKQVLRSSDIAARLGGDEFAVVAGNIEDSARASLVAEKIIAGLSRPFEVSGQVIETGASIGISISNPKESQNSDEMIRRADTALYQAKSGGRGVFRFFEDTMLLNKANILAPTG